ncbi:hypothetical protein ACLOJK_011832 [Asimina triloba]
MDNTPLDADFRSVLLANMFVAIRRLRDFEISRLKIGWKAEKSIPMVPARQYAMQRVKSNKNTDAFLRLRDNVGLGPRQVSLAIPKARVSTVVLLRELYRLLGARGQQSARMAWGRQAIACVDNLSRSSALDGRAILSMHMVIRAGGIKKTIYCHVTRWNIMN